MRRGRAVACMLRERDAAHRRGDAHDALGRAAGGGGAVAEQDVGGGAREQEQPRDDREHGEHERARLTRHRGCHGMQAVAGVAAAVAQRLAVEAGRAEQREQAERERDAPTRNGRSRRGSARRRRLPARAPSASGASTTPRPAVSSRPLLSAPPSLPPPAPAHSTSTENAASAPSARPSRSRYWCGASSGSRTCLRRAARWAACGQDERYERALAAPSRSCGGLPSTGASTQLRPLLQTGTRGTRPESVPAPGVSLRWRPGRPRTTRVAEPAPGGHRGAAPNPWPNG